MLDHARRACALLSAGLLGACAGNGAGLDANGDPVAAGGAASPPPLTADFQSIQDNVFTPVCVRCHSGANAPQGLQLDAAHSYAMLVGVPSNEVPTRLRVDPGAPQSSYLVLKLAGAAGIVGSQMPFGGPPLPQATIDVIRQWISDGAQAAAGAAAHFAVTMATVSQPAVDAPAQLLIAFSGEPDLSLLNDTTLRLEVMDAAAARPPLPLSWRQPKGDAQALLLSPQAPLTPGHYRLTLRGSGATALADVDARTLTGDYQFDFSVGGQ